MFRLKKNHKSNSGGYATDMDAIGKELEAKRAILDQEQWAQNVEGYM